MGKAYVNHDGSVVHWQVDAESAPHHWDIAEALGHEPRSLIPYIFEDGKVIAPSHRGQAGDAQLVADAVGGYAQKDTWNFSKAAAEIPEMDGLPLYGAWQPGQYGKGTFVDGQPHLWSVDDYGSPHHHDIAMDLGGEPDGHFFVHPDGQVERQGTGDVDKFVAHDPRLRPYGEEDDWKFGASAWTVVPGKTTPQSTSYDTANDREAYTHHPIIVDPANKRVHIGTPGTHHIDLLNEGAPQTGEGGAYQGLLYPEGSKLTYASYDASGAVDHSVIRALGTHMGQEVGLEGGWAFSSVQPSAWENTWVKGARGKGYVTADGRTVTWGEEFPYTSHAEVAHMRGDDMDGYGFYITPEGALDINSGYPHLEKVKALGFTHTPEQERGWFSSKGPALSARKWQPIFKMAEDSQGLSNNEDEFDEDDYLEGEGWLTPTPKEPLVNYVKHDRAYGDHYTPDEDEEEEDGPHHEHPFVFDGSQFHVGEPNSFHWDLIGELPHVKGVISPGPHGAPKGSEAIGMGRYNPSTNSLVWSSQGKYRRDHLEDLTQQAFPGAYDESKDMGFEHNDDWHFGSVHEHEPWEQTEGATRPFLFNGQDIHLGWPGASHADLGEDFDDFRAGVINNDGHAHFLERGTPEEEQGVTRSLSEHLGYPVRSDSHQDDWHFGSTLPDYSHIDKTKRGWTSQIPAWTPGTYGKAIIDLDHKLHTWSVDANDGPHHEPYGSDKGAFHASIALNPDNTYQHLHGDRELVQQAMAPLGLTETKGWSLSRTATQVQIHQTDHSPEAHKWSSPFIYDPQADKLHVGMGDGIYHRDLWPHVKDEGHDGWISHENQTFQWYNPPEHTEHRQPAERAISEHFGKPYREMNDDDWNLSKVAANLPTVEYVDPIEDDATHGTDDRPFIYYPDHDVIHIGQHNGYHADIEHHGENLRAYNDDGDGTIHGRTDGATHTFHHKVSPEHKALFAQAFGTKEEGDTWNFAKVTHDYKQWRPVIGIDGELFWGSGPDIYHADVARRHNLTPEQVSRSSFGRGTPDYIDWYTTTSQETSERVGDEDELWRQNGPDAWDFSKHAVRVADANDDGYFYHVAPHAFHEQIMQGGLQPGQEKIWKGLKEKEYPSNVYMWGSLKNAQWYATSLNRRAKNMIHVPETGEFINGDEHNNGKYNIYRVHGKGLKLEMDPYLRDSVDSDHVHWNFPPKKITGPAWMAHGAIGPERLEHVQHVNFGQHWGDESNVDKDFGRQVDKVPMAYQQLHLHRQTNVNPVNHKWTPGKPAPADNDPWKFGSEQIQVVPTTAMGTFHQPWGTENSIFEDSKRVGSQPIIYAHNRRALCIGAVNSHHSDIIHDVGDQIGIDREKPEMRADHWWGHIRDGEVEFLRSDPPRQLLNKLEEMGIQRASQGVKKDLWHFGNYQEDLGKLPAPLKAWEPGMLGKGLVTPEGRAYAWQISSDRGLDGYPSHDQAGKALGLGNLFEGHDGWDEHSHGFYTVFPNGKMDRLMGPEHHDQAMQAHLPQEALCSDCGHPITPDAEGDFVCKVCKFTGNHNDHLGDDEEDWRFGATAFKPWTPGTWGKGLAWDNQTILWNTGTQSLMGGKPHHRQVASDHMTDDEFFDGLKAKTVWILQINPEGKIYDALNGDKLPEWIKAPGTTPDEAPGWGF